LNDAHTAVQSHEKVLFQAPKTYVFVGTEENERSECDVNNIVVGLYGMMCSGKDTVAAILEQRGYKKLSMSDDVLKPILLSLKKRPDRLNYIKISKALKSMRPEILAYLTHGLVNKGEGHKYIIPNFMKFEEAKYFKEQKDIKFVLIKVNADQMTRYERNLQRKDEKDVNELIKFKRLDQKNLTMTGLKELMHARLEDVEITNNGTREELQNNVEEVIKRLEL